MALLGLSLLSLGACPSAPQPQFRGGPRLALEPAAIDFGQLPAGRSAQHQLTLTNIGDAPLLIEQAVPRVVEGCCPPLLEMEGLTLSPGRSRVFSVPIKMPGDMTGPHRFEIQIYSNDAVAPVATLVIQGVVVPP